MNTKLDYKKEYKDLYMPKKSPNIIDVPAMSFIMVEGKGNPNVEGGEYQKAVELLYALTYTIKMSKMGKNKPINYFDYVVPPLEGLWWLNDDSHFDFSEKDEYCWISMIRQPEFITMDLYDWACKEVNKKKPHINTSIAKLQTWTEGLCVQMMHIGPFDDEWKSTKLLDDFSEKNNYQTAISDVLPDGTIRRHHEIYLGDPRELDPQKKKTVLRHPVKKKD